MSHLNISIPNTPHRWKLLAVLGTVFAVLLWAGQASAARGSGGMSSGGGGGRATVSGGGGGRAIFSGGGGSSRANFSNGSRRTDSVSRSFTRSNQNVRVHRDRDDSRKHVRHRSPIYVPVYTAPIYETVTTYVDDDVDWDDCPALKRRALRTDSSYWWKKYRQCRAREDDED